MLKVLALADVHQSENHWVMLEEAVRWENPVLVVIAGDLLPKYEGILAQADFGSQLREHARAIRKTGAELVLILGNDDNQLLIPEMEKGNKEGLWHYVADRVKEINGYEFCGCPWIRDYPFAYKYWVAPDSEDECYLDPIQLGPPAEIDSNNEIVTIPDLEVYLKEKMPVKSSLENMARQTKNLRRSVWLIHDPPAYTGLDLCATGDEVGSSVVYRFILERSPLITIHGHIHESPEYNEGIWAKKLGDTLCIQAGQLEKELSYVTFELAGEAVRNLKHSLYGPWIQ
ncbi:MAG: metallophosphoesterase family protein [Bacillota bacterium]